MKTCQMCSAELPEGRRRYCSDACFNANRASKQREHYRANPAYAEAQKAAVRAWSRTHREQRNALSRSSYWRRKARRIACVLAKVRS